MISEQQIFTCIPQVDDGQRDPQGRGVTLGINECDIGATDIHMYSAG